jgi:hypothetical protein
MTQQPVNAREMCCRTFVIMIDAIELSQSSPYEAPPNNWNDLVMPKM